MLRPLGYWKKTVSTTALRVGQNEVQTITITGTPTGGDFTLTFSGQTTSAIAYDADGTAITTALVALSNVASGDIVVTGSAGGPFTATFGGAYEGLNVALMTANSAGLTGGTSPTVSVALTTQGGFPAGTNRLLVYVESQPITWRADGTAPTAAAGMPIAAGVEREFDLAWWDLLQVIRQGGTNATVHFVPLG